MDEKLTKAQIKEQRHKERQEWESKMSKEVKFAQFKRIGIWAVAGIITLLCVWGLITLVNTSPSSQDLALTAPKVTKTDLSFGPDNAKATVIEYADFQCPSCKAQQANIDQLKKDYNGKIKYIYRFFPIQQIHQNADLSAAAGYSAYLQGKFEQMADLLFANQDSWATQPADQAQKIFVSYAKSLNLDTDKFQQDMNSASTKKFIQDEMNGGVAAGINATPTFFINGKQFQIPADYSGYKQIIDSALSGK